MVRFDRQSPGGHVSVKRLETFGGVVSSTHGDFSSGMEEGENEEEEGGFSALKKLMDIRWIENLRSSAWKLS